jgi:hypothetical protein
MRLLVPASILPNGSPSMKYLDLNESGAGDYRAFQGAESVGRRTGDD